MLVNEEHITTPISLLRDVVEGRNESGWGSERLEMIGTGSLGMVKVVFGAVFKSRSNVGVASLCTRSRDDG